ncbi:MAG: ABC transporter substrate-binding protein [Burkholderiaceae bacterium]
MQRYRFISALTILVLGLSQTIAHSAQIDIPILYVKQQIERPPVRSDLVSWPADEGEQGSKLGIADSNTTGKFLGHRYHFETMDFAVGADILGAMKQRLADGSKIVVINAPADILNAIADLPAARDDLIFNAGSASDALRDAQCRPNLLHTLPSRAMLADALMQFLAAKKWRDIFLVEGNRPGDTAFANALRRSAKKFQLTIKHEKKWLLDVDIRRNAAREVPVFTQARAYDVVVVADEDHDFGQYLMYNTWLPRPVAGNAGVQPVAWHRAVEQWGAAQLQSRFSKAANRAMTSIDYAAWAAVRSVAEAVTRTKSSDTAAIRSYLFSDEFSLAGFKGSRLTYRRWNGQLRQPIPLAHPDAIVAAAPIEGFLHRQTELDTLGLDQPESKCKEMN